MQVLFQASPVSGGAMFAAPRQTLEKALKHNNLPFTRLLNGGTEGLTGFRLLVPTEPDQKNTISTLQSKRVLNDDQRLVSDPKFHVSVLVDRPKIDL